MDVRLRKSLFLVLVLVFFTQTWFVYTDPLGRQSPPLSKLAREGRAIWHENNCQSCHQLYGYGGFLGPDLTNASARLTSALMDTVLSVGAGQMPPFHLDEHERHALVTYLAEVDLTGVGQLAPPAGVTAEEVLEQAIAAAGVALGPRESRGRDVLLEQNCLGCHLPNPLAEKKGTSLTLLIPKLGGQGALAIMGSGIPMKGMPRFELEPADREDLVAFLTWLAGHAELVQQTFDSAPLRIEGGFSLPWFEYTR